jgi:hypothetical protein
MLSTSVTLLALPPLQDAAPQPGGGGGGSGGDSDGRGMHAGCLHDLCVQFAVLKGRQWTDERVVRQVLDECVLSISTRLVRSSAAASAFRLFLRLTHLRLTVRLAINSAGTTGRGWTTLSCSHSGGGSSTISMKTGKTQLLQSQAAP